MATVIQMHRVFRLGATDLPDPDSDLNPEQVLEHFKTMFPTLRYGKINEVGAENDQLVYELVPNEYKANG